MVIISLFAPCQQCSSTFIGCRRRLNFFSFFLTQYPQKRKDWSICHQKLVGGTSHKGPTPILSIFFLPEPNLTFLPKPPKVPQLPSTSKKAKAVKTRLQRPPKGQKGRPGRKKALGSFPCPTGQANEPQGLFPGLAFPPGL